MGKSMSENITLQNENKTPIRTATLAYFSGTGGTEAIVRCVEAQLIKAGIKVKIVDIPFCEMQDNKLESDLLVIFSPVYAFRLVSIVERWTKNLPHAQNTFAAVISVSGGGEVSPNTACRAHCKRLLKKKGYHLVYEKMLVMPSNFVIQAERSINLKLIQVMLKKTEQIVTEILSGKINLIRPLLWDYAFAFIGQAEHLGARIFGLSFHASKECTKCGLCIRKCPAKNIQIKNGMPSFGFHCMFCLKCIYSCPHHAISPRILRFVILKNGYDIEKMIEEAKLHSDIEQKFTKSFLWQGVIDYLK